MRKCPECGHDKFKVFYTDPPIYECKRCEHRHTDPNEGPRVLSREEGMKKRPEMYRLAGYCPSCGGDPDVDCICNLRNA